MSQQFELDFDFGSLEPAALSPPDPAPAGDAPSPAAQALNGLAKPAPMATEKEEQDVPDEDELLAMMEQDARENLARDVENLEALKRKEDVKKAAAARRRAAIMAALGNPLQEITNAPTQPTQTGPETQPTQRTQDAQRNGESSMFEADFDFGEPAAASCEYPSSPHLHLPSFGARPGSFLDRQAFTLLCSFWPSADSSVPHRGHTAPRGPAHQACVRRAGPPSPAPCRRDGRRTHDLLRAQDETRHRRHLCELGFPCDQLTNRCRILRAS